MKRRTVGNLFWPKMVFLLFYQEIVDNDDGKTYAHIAGGSFSAPHPFLEGKILFSKENTPFYGKIIFFDKRSSGLWREASPPKCS